MYRIQGNLGAFEPKQSMAGPSTSAPSRDVSEAQDLDSPDHPSKTHFKRDVNELKIMCPWSYMLKFHDASDETRFVQSLVLSCGRTDKVSCIIPLVLTPVKALTSDISDHWHFFLGLVVFYVWIPLCMWYLMSVHPNFYLRNRTLLHSLMRPVIVVGCAHTSQYEHLWSKVPPLQMLGNMTTKSCIVPLLTTTFGMRLPFARHLIVQLTANICSAFWVNGLSDACMVDSSIADEVNLLGNFTEWLITFPSKGSPLKPGKFSCQLVGLFYHLWLGFVVPSMLLYCTECWARWNYLEYVSSSTNKFLKDFRKASLQLAGLVFLVSSQLVWFGLNMWFHVVKSSEGKPFCLH